MILLTLLLIMMLILAAIVVCSLAIGGAAFVIVFGDVIECIFLIGWLIKKLSKRKSKKK